VSSHPGQGGAPEGARGPGLPTIDVNEYGGKKDGERQVLNTRLFMQLLVFDCPSSPAAAIDVLARELTARKAPFVIYEDTCNPRGIGLLTWSEDPALFVTAVRGAVNVPELASLRLVPEFTMLGRTYSTGHEPDLPHAILHRSRENVLNAAYPWHVWYPLRRTGAFARLEPHDQSIILREHATIGMAYGAQELAHDIRLACHGIDAKDNEFVIGLVGRDLHPLSHLVQTMRKTKQTSEFISQMGPFFVGYVARRSA
jgi:hypothetical protein